MSPEARKAAARSAIHGVVDRVEDGVATVETSEGFRDVPAEGLVEGQRLSPERTQETQTILEELRDKAEPVQPRRKGLRLFRRK